MTSALRSNWGALALAGGRQWPTSRRRRFSARAKAARLQARADAMMAEFNHYRKDIAWLTQPAAGTAFGRRRERITARYRKGRELEAEAQKLRERADRWEQHGIPEQGDAERAREQRRAANDEQITVGSRVYFPISGHGEVLKVNKKTYRIRFRSRIRGEEHYDTLVDKSLVKLAEEE